MQLPNQGKTKDEIIHILEAYKGNDINWRSGRVLAYVYDPGQDVQDVSRQAYMMFLTENGLDPTTFPSLLRLEVEVVRMMANLLRGDENVVGNLTSGGTESIMLAVKAVRDKARAERPHITAPEMVLPMTAHAAFHKAAHYLGIRPIVTPFDPVTFQADTMAMRNAINDNTILLVASAPIYSQGVVDPIPEIGTLALEKNICFHVDACVGGIHLAIMREMGYNVPLFDLTIKGITSISVDLHKYGYAAKGASAILYRDKSLRRYQIYACADTTAYDLINATILSSKTGGPIAGSWAILNYLGMDGYKQIVRAVQDATGKLIDGINRTGDLRILGKPDMCMFSFTSDTIDLFQLADEMRGVGWYLQPQFSTPISPINLHVSVNYGTVDHVEQFLSDLHACVRKVKDLPPTDYSALKSAVASILQNPSPEVIGQIIAMAGLQGSSLPDKMAPIYAVLDTLPKPFANALLVEYFNNLYS